MSDQTNLNNKSSQHFSLTQIIPENEELDWEHRNQSVSYLHHCIAGSFAGIMEHILMLPIDNIKTHMQALKIKMSFLETIKYIYKKDGFIKFWNGASVIASGCIPAHACYFSVYEFSKEKFLTNLAPKWHPYVYGLTGVCATIIHDAILCPIDMLKQRIQIAPSHLKKASYLFKHIMKEEGFFSLYRSFFITLFMNLPTSFIFVGLNENFKTMFKPKDGHTYLSWFLCAGAAGAFASGLTIPMDVIKTKLQTQDCFGMNEICPIQPCETCPINQEKTINSKIPDNNKSILKEKNPSKFMNISAELANTTFKDKSTIQAEESIRNHIVYTDVTTTIKKIMLEDGYKGFVKGIFPRMLAQAPSAAISWTTYEAIKSYLFERSKETI